MPRERNFTIQDADCFGKDAARDDSFFLTAKQLKVGVGKANADQKENLTATIWTLYQAHRIKTR